MDSIMPRDTRSDPSELLMTMIRDIGGDVKKLGDLAARNDESLKGIWREIRDDVKPSIRELAKEQRSLFSDHQDQCPALQAFFVRASSKDTPSKPFKSIVPRNGNRVIWYWFTGVGVALGTAAVIVLKKLGLF